MGLWVGTDVGADVGGISQSTPILPRSHGGRPRSQGGRGTSQGGWAQGGMVRSQMGLEGVGMALTVGFCVGLWVGWRVGASVMGGTLAPHLYAGAM